MGKRFAYYAFFCLILGIFSLGTPVCAAEKALTRLYEPVLLPTSPFYFLKEWRWNLMRTFTRDPPSRVVLELDVLDEKAAELKKIHELNSGDYSAIKSALLKYKAVQDALRNELNAVSSIPEEKDRDALVQELFNRLSAHNKVFKTISSAYPENEQVVEQVKDVQEKIADAAAEASVNISETKLKEFIKSSFVPVGFSNVEEMSDEFAMIERMREAAPESVKRSFENIQEEIFMSTSTATSTTSSLLLAPIINMVQAEKEGVLCAQVYDPVCGEDNKTYANTCLAQNAGVAIQQKGECKKKNE